MENASIVKPVDSSSVIVIREPYEVLLMERSKSQSFLAGASVFPGGALDYSDMNFELRSFAGGFTPYDALKMLQDDELSENKAIGLYFCAVRELFEESGIMLAGNKEQANLCEIAGNVGITGAS